MKGVVLAGGTGSRLRPMTHVVNKHILPVYDKPMIFYPVETLLNSGIDEILVVSTPEDIGRYITLLDQEFDADFTYRVQSEPEGIADALRLAREFTDESIAVILGDNIVMEDLSSKFDDFHQNDASAQIFLKEVEQPARYGIANVSDGEIQNLTEKPETPNSNYAVIGLYLYDKSVFEKIDSISKSDRGEYEITAVNERYLESDQLDYTYVDGDWFDVGTPEGLFKASTSVRQKRTD